MEMCRPVNREKPQLSVYLLMNEWADKRATAKRGRWEALTHDGEEMGKRVRRESLRQDGWSENEKDERNKGGKESERQESNTKINMRHTWPEPNV